MEPTDPLNAEETEPAFSHEYRGRLKAVVQTISTVGTIELDHDQYARWELTGTGAVTLTLANWQDGDRGEVVIDTTKQTFSIPAAWIVPDEVWDAWTETPGKYCMEIRQEGGAVFAHAAVPFNTGGGSSGGEWTIGQNGNWYCDGIDSGNPSRGAKGDKGDTGNTGSTGAAAGFGTPTASVSTLAAGSNATASVTASGTNTSKVFAFSFGIPKGAKGDTGATGATGPQGPKGDTGDTFKVVVSSTQPANPTEGTIWIQQ